MTLDLVIRGTGSTRSPEEHLAALAPEYPSSLVLLYGQTADVQAAVHVPAEPTALNEALGNATGESALVYGDESLLAMGNALSPSLIWVALGSDANGVREVWRLRQQHGWLTGKKLGLLVEHVEGTPEPDLERMMRLSRAAQAVVVAPLAASESAAPAMTVLPAQDSAVVGGAEEEPAAEPEPVPVAAAEEVAATASEPVEEAPAPVTEPVAEPEPEPAQEPEPEPAAEPEAAPEPESETTEAVAPALPQETHHDQTEGATTIMLENEMDRAPEASAPAGATAEQALIQRYALVKERRSTASRIAEVEANMQNLLKELFVSRFAAGPEAAAAFEQVAAKLAETSGEFTQLSKTMARIEAGLAQLAWLKDELEI